MLPWTLPTVLPSAVVASVSVFCVSFCEPTLRLAPEVDRPLFFSLRKWVSAWVSVAASIARSRPAASVRSAVDRFRVLRRY
ncbi:hypothetical protein [Thauera linaloolentis]|uniref:Uncharacterized protein n=1 Tax=Thauera linaloolentis (strain DSM 12138 / JCM 21573 / CCUG 41526 / CIP 105981 / IAM 15112 / NBRC 102519 / 47Lol) TaxID=1123367 RepID=N6ZCD7_THAL4|nr:hypothetical protein [Thauera linaloolentis]ENO89829.1 hypothetical protein C666_04630 [Thauera linaloolentis 47Lol = DSM 12138]MCM8566981.1 hypothetical protein [Thauera linaloolentis]